MSRGSACAEPFYKCRICGIVICFVVFGELLIKTVDGRNALAIGLLIMGYVTVP